VAVIVARSQGFEELAAQIVGLKDVPAKSTSHLRKGNQGRRLHWDGGAIGEHSDETLAIHFRWVAFVAQFTTNHGLPVSPACMQSSSKRFLSLLERLVEG